VRILKISAAVLASLVGAGCGGGGAGSGDTISVVFDYGAARNGALYTSVDTGAPLIGPVPGEHFQQVSGSFAPGVTLDASTGDVHGVPTQAGSYSAVVELTVSGYTGSAKSTFAQTVVDVSLVPAELTTYHTGGSFFIQLGVLTAAGTEGVVEDAPHGIDLTYRMAAGSTLPPALTMDAHSGLISGIENLPIGIYPGLLLEAVVTVGGVSHVYTQPAVTLTVLPRVA
jgi:hypothetical protein